MALSNDDDHGEQLVFHTKEEIDAAFEAFQKETRINKMDFFALTFCLKKYNYHIQRVYATCLNHEAPQLDFGLDLLLLLRVSIWFIPFSI